MFIMIEGIDGTGKSVLVKNLSEITDMTAVKPMSDHFPWMRLNGISGLNDPMIDMVVPDVIRMTGIDLITDRCLLSVMAYKLHRKEIGLSRARMIIRYWEKKMLPKSSFLVMLSLNMESSYAIRSHRFSVKQLLHLEKQYYQLLDIVTIPVIYHSYEQDGEALTPEESAQRVWSKINSHD